MSANPVVPVLSVIRGRAPAVRVEHRLSPTQKLTIGRDPASVLVIEDEHVSANHAEIIMVDGQVLVRDKSSTNGTRIVRNGALVDADGSGKALYRRERIHLGDASSPVVVEYYESADAEREHHQSRVVALTHIGRVEDVEGRVSSDPTLLRRLYAGLKRIGRALDLAAVIEAAVDVLFDMMQPATHVTIMLESETAAGRFIPIASVRRDGVPEGARPVSRWLRAQVLEARTGLLASDRENDLLNSQSLQQQSVASVIAAPLWIGDRIIGIAQIDRRADVPPELGEARIFRQDDLELAMVLASQLAVSIEHARVHQRLIVSEDKLKRENRFLKGRDTPNSMIGQSSAMRSILDLINKVTGTTVPVCVFGETGTGKELVARTVHTLSDRGDELFVAQNCAALPEDLLESELFGHKRGAFTGADSDKKGLFEIAHGGTIFLDEIGETTPAMQAKLLRVLQEKEIRPVGAVKTQRVDVRVISATNRNLEEEVAEGRFRQDLYYRLNVFPITLPPLRDRGDDIGLLADFFMRRYAAEFARPPMTFSAAAIDVMRAYNWPGNIRELQNEIQRAIICATGEFVMPDDLSPRIRMVERTLRKAGGDSDDGTLKDRLAKVERYMLIEALRAHGNNKTKTAKSLGITREGLHKKLTRFRI